MSKVRKSVRARGVLTVLLPEVMAANAAGSPLTVDTIFAKHGGSDWLPKTYSSKARKGQAVPPPYAVSTAIGAVLRNEKIRAKLEATGKLSAVEAEFAKISGLSAGGDDAATASVIAQFDSEFDAIMAQQATQKRR